MNRTQELQGHGACGGCVSILNGIPLGVGAALGIDLPAHARVRVELGGAPDGSVGETLVDLRNGVAIADHRVPRAVAATLSRCVGQRIDVREAAIDVPIPMGVGLKTSSISCVALTRAMLAAVGTRVSAEAELRLAVSAALSAGVTRTGALDDTAGAALGGLVVANVRTHAIVRHWTEPPLAGHVLGSLRVIIAVPRDDVAVPSAQVGAHLFDRVHPLLQRAQDAALAGELVAAWTDNGTAVAQALGQSQAQGIQQRMLSLGALAAGVSGTGPAVAGLTTVGGAAAIVEGLEGVSTELHQLRPASVQLRVGALPPLEEVLAGARGGGVRT